MAATPVVPADQVFTTNEEPTEVVRAARIAELQATVADLESAIGAQRRIGAVIGILAARYRCQSEQAWEMLADLSRQTTMEVAALSEILLDVFDGGSAGPADVDLLTALAERLPADRLPVDRLPAAMDVPVAVRV